MLPETLHLPRATNAVQLPEGIAGQPGRKDCAVDVSGYS